MAKGQWSGVLQHIRQLIGVRQGSDVTDRQLLERFAAQQDESAFSALLQRHGPMVLGVCQRVLGHVHDAEDAFQATFLVLARKATAVPWHDSVGNWLYGVAWRVALKVRTAAARQTTCERQGRKMEATEPSDEQTWRELRPVLDEELNQLPAKYRAPLVCCYLEGKSVEEAAQELGCPRGTILSRLARGRERLRLRLVQRGVALSSAALATVLPGNASAAVPAVLAEATAKAALPFAAGQTVAGLVSERVVGVVEAVLQAMFFARITIAAAVVLVLVALGTGAGVVAHHVLAENQLAGNGPGQVLLPSKPRLDPPTLPLGAVVAYEKDRSITLEALTSSGKRNFPFLITPNRTEVRVIGGQDIAVGMNATVWADRDDPKQAARIVANPKSPTAQGKILAYEEGKSITLGLTTTNVGGRQAAFLIERDVTEVRLLQGLTGITVGQNASVWVDSPGPAQNAPAKAALIEAYAK
jgi:RNA polymerase sigma factor (sigma-70 family)